MIRSRVCLVSALAIVAGLAQATTLYVSSPNNNEVLHYDGSTGASVNNPLVNASGGLISPQFLALGPNGNLFVSDAASEVQEYNPSTGAHVTTFVSSGSGGL